MIHDRRELDCDELREYLMALEEALDALDEIEYFGHEGWRQMLLGE